MKKLMLLILVSVVVSFQAFSAPIGGSGTDIGGGLGASKLNLEWCDNGISILRNVKMRASAKLMFSSYMEANAMLTDGMVQALSKDGASLSYTRKALENGLELLSSYSVSTIKEAQVLNSFLNNYYDFVINKAALLDKFFFTSEFFISGKDVGINEIEMRVVRFAREQLSFIATHLTRRVDIGGYYEMVPLGSSKLVLHAIRVFSKNIATDLMNSFFVYEKLEAANSLIYLSNALDEYLSGNLSVFYDDRIALNLALIELAKLEI
jgi:hypothetical protein